MKNVRPPTLVACADTGSFSAAAQRVNRTQSTVSGQIARVEEMLGEPAFRRTAKGVVPTTVGEQLLNYARRLLALQDEMAQVVPGVQPSGNLRLGVSEYVTPNRIGACLRTLADQFPKLGISLQIAQSSALLRRLGAGEIDLMPGTSLEKTLPANAKALGHERLRWVSCRRWEFACGDEVPLVLLESTCSIHLDALTRLTDAGLKPRVVMTVSGALAVHAAVAADVGLGYLNESAIPSTLMPLGLSSGLPESGKVYPYVLSGGEVATTNAADVVVQALLASLDLKGQDSSTQKSRP